MYDLFKKIVSTGFELEDKIIDSLDELVTKGKISPDEREKFLKNLDEKMDETRDKGEEFISEVEKKLAMKNPFACKKDLEALEKKVQQLEKQLSKQEVKKPTKARPKRAATAKKPEQTVAPEENVNS